MVSGVEVVSWNISRLFLIHFVCFLVLVGSVSSCVVLFIDGRESCGENENDYSEIRRSTCYSKTTTLHDLQIWTS